MFLPYSSRIENQNTREMHGGETVMKIFNVCIVFACWQLWHFVQRSFAGNKSFRSCHWVLGGCTHIGSLALQITHKERYWPYPVRLSSLGKILAYPWHWASCWSRWQTQVINKSWNQATGLESWLRLPVLDFSDSPYNNDKQLWGLN